MLPKEVHIAIHNEKLRKIPLLPQRHALCNAQDKSSIKIPLNFDGNYK